jgi:hypothetical protein
MNCLWRYLLSLLLLVGVATAEQPGNCPVEAYESCNSFKQLVTANDKEIMASLSTTSWVCFRPRTDEFIIFHMKPLSSSAWQWSNDAQWQIQYSGFLLSEYRDGVRYRFEGVGHYWHRSNSDSEPIFSPESIGKNATPTFYPKSTGHRFFITDTEISVDYPFLNQNNGTTQYSLVIRRSTARFTESYTAVGAGGTPTIIKHSGSCFVYNY